MTTPNPKRMVHRPLLVWRDLRLIGLLWHPVQGRLIADLRYLDGLVEFEPLAEIMLPGHAPEEFEHFLLNLATTNTDDELAAVPFFVPMWAITPDTLKGERCE